MYGLLFEILRKFIETTYNHKIWSQCLHDVIGNEKIFQINQTYCDQLYNQLINNLSNQLNISINNLYIENGKYFIQFLIDTGYMNILKVMGKDFIDFLTNIDEIHKQLKRLYPFIRPPSFTITNIEYNGDHLSSDQASCKFRGEMRFVEDWNMLLFLGAPSIRDTKQLNEHGLYICDLNMFDRSRDVIICGEQISDELIKLFQVKPNNVFVFSF
ncbi:Soluble guanylate cyclase 88E [Schistosoma japonicum]|nr:Soluble guanylate cyclase 88E [Schistosoma japonicum]